MFCYLIFNVLFKVINVFKDQSSKIMQIHKVLQPIGFSQCPDFKQESILSQVIDVEKNTFIHSTYKQIIIM